MILVTTDAITGKELEMLGLVKGSTIQTKNIGRDITQGLKTIVGVHAYEGGTGMTLPADIAALENVPVEGVCLFREGAHVMAFAKGTQLDLYNPLDEEITRIEVFAGEESAPVVVSIPHGAEVTIRLPFAPEALRTFANDKEVCIYLHRRNEA